MASSTSSHDGVIYRFPWDGSVQLCSLRHAEVTRLPSQSMPGNSSPAGHSHLRNSASGAGLHNSEPGRPLWWRPLVVCAVLLAPLLGFYNWGRPAPSGALRGHQDQLRRSSHLMAGPTDSSLPPLLQRPRILLFGDSLTERSFDPEGGWGASLAHRYARKVPGEPCHVFTDSTHRLCVMMAAAWGRCSGCNNSSNSCNVNGGSSNTCSGNSNSCNRRAGSQHTQ